ncbi:MAG: UDP-2,3-diacylglucosamine diphosphatase [Nevskiales bacterium]|nr:UDP-2,3-diacylglucosamine diphosphatase [Nevskiales bacterium]
MIHSVLFVSDLHLPPTASPLRETFARFLAGPARTAAAVYILGDLFEYWIGDNEGLKDYADEVQGLTALTQSGVPVYYQHGNRDFMVGRTFFFRTGVRLLADPFPLEEAAVPTLISHGDIFCTDDVSYQRWRRFSRHGGSQRAYRMLPVSLRQKIAGKLRSQSARKQYRPEDIMDVNAEAIRAAFRQYGACRLIHGHTHRPAEHRYDIDGRECRRLVLADWRPGRCEVLKLEDSAVQRTVLSD